MSGGNAKLSIEKDGSKVFVRIKAGQNDVLPMLAILIQDAAQTMGMPFQMAMTALMVAGPPPETDSVKINLAGVKGGSEE